MHDYGILKMEKPQRICEFEKKKKGFCCFFSLKAGCSYVSAYSEEMGWDREDGWVGGWVEHQYPVQEQR